MQGHKEVWFSNATPKYAFVTWLVMKNWVATWEKWLNGSKMRIQDASSERSFRDEGALVLSMSVLKEGVGESGKWDSFRKILSKMARYNKGACEYIS